MFKGEGVVDHLKVQFAHKRSAPLSRVIWYTIPHLKRASKLLSLTAGYVQFIFLKNDIAPVYYVYEVT